MQLAKRLQCSNLFEFIYAQGDTLQISLWRHSSDRQQIVRQEHSSDDPRCWSHFSTSMRLALSKLITVKQHRPQSAAALFYKSLPKPKQSLSRDRRQFMLPQTPNPADKYCDKERYQVIRRIQCNKEIYNAIRRENVIRRDINSILYTTPLHSTPSSQIR